MPPRQLRRALTRSIAAAWRPGPGPRSHAQKLSADLRLVRRQSTNRRISPLGIPSTRLHAAHPEVSKLPPVLAGWDEPESGGRDSRDSRRAAAPANSLDRLEAIAKAQAEASRRPIRRTVARSRTARWDERDNTGEKRPNASRPDAQDLPHAERRARDTSTEQRSFSGQSLWDSFFSEDADAAKTTPLQESASVRGGRGNVATPVKEHGGPFVSQGMRPSQDAAERTSPGGDTPKSLFDELFPTLDVDPPPQPSPDAVAVPSSAPPRLVYDLEEMPQGLPDLEDSSGVLDVDENPETDSSRSKKPVNMLVLSGAGKSLMPSDFYRLGAQGHHVEGWVSGITSVVQARNPYTLEPLGQYYIFFSNKAAAISYYSEFIRLWTLSKDYVSGSRRSSGSEERIAPLANSDELAAVQSFTLLPPSQNYNLRLARSDARRKADVDRGASIVARVAERLGTPWLVLVAVESGRITPDMLLSSIRGDARQRNRPWYIYNGPANILPFGANGPRAAAGDGDDEVEDRRFPRFILPLNGENEARRFIRVWHRRQITFKVEDEVNTTKSWEQNMTFNVSALF